MSDPQQVKRETHNFMGVPLFLILEGGKHAMLLMNIGAALFWVGFVLVLGNIVPYKRDRQLKQEYELAKAKREKPHTDAEYWHHAEVEYWHIRHLFLRIGAVLAGAGGLVWIIGYLIRG